MIKATIFDFDGVLGDTWETGISICRDLGMNFTLDDYLDHHNGNVFEKPKLNFSDQQANDFYCAYAERADKKNLFPLENELKKLSEKYKLYIVSSNQEAAIEKYLTIGDWSKYFDKVLGVDTDRSKVNKFNLLFKNNKFKAEECVFVTDTLGDLIEGNKVGIHTLAVTWGYHGEMRLKEGKPEKIIHEFNELANVVEGFN